MPSKNKILLVIEDEEPLRRALKDMLGFEGFTIIEAGNGADGLHAALSEHPDLILLDIVMPKMDGLTMLRKLRADDWGKTAPVIVLTNLGDNEKEVEAAGGSVSEYFVKNEIRIDEVISKIKEKLV